MIINHNASAAYASRNLGITQSNLAQDIARLSSGQRITRAADDAAGLAVSETLRAQVRGLNQAERNIQNGVSFVQATEGYLQGTQDILHRLRELAVQSANGVFTDADREMIRVEADQLKQEVDRIAEHAQFNGMNLLDGTFAEGGDRDGMYIQVGANVDQRVQMFVGEMTVNALQIGEINLADGEDANMAIATLDSALLAVSSQRADLGAYQNRFESAARSVAVASENLQASESRIRDADMATEVVNFTRNQILSQSGSAMLAQANVQSQAVLQLL